MTEDIERLRAALRDDARMLFNTEEGNRLLEDMKRRYGMYSPTFSGDPHETSYREGQRSVVLYVMSLLRDEPTQGDDSG
tara:strand:+ start:4662 stop:4898 length:237 start_codon:yes stop_codon:yes gene_type:complete